MHYMGAPGVLIIIIMSHDMYSQNYGVQYGGNEPAQYNPGSYPQQSYQPNYAPPSQSYGNPPPQNNYFYDPSNAGGQQNRQFVDPLISSLAANPGIATAAFDTLTKSGREYVASNIDRYVGKTGLKSYFDVDTSYVMRKIMRLLFPFTVPTKDWFSATPREGGSKHSPREDCAAVDLYIPSMAFVTYLLAYGWMLGAEGRFTPDTLGTIASASIAYWIIEVGLLWAFVWVASASDFVPILHICAYASYKFLPMVFIIIVSGAFGWWASFMTASLLSLSLTVFTVRSLKPRLLADASPMIRKYRLYVLGVAAFCQPIALLWGVLRPF